MMGRNSGKVTQEVLQSILLDEIAGRLAKIQEHLEKQVPEGNIFPIGLIANTTPQKIVLTFSATIFNDGAADIYILDRNRTLDSSDQPLKVSEGLEIDHREKGQYEHWIATAAGTATVRIFALN